MQKQKDKKKHHYYSQCYLNGFANTSTKKPHLNLFDLTTKKVTPARPKDICFENNFNRIDREHTEPNELEFRIGRIESDFARAVKNVTNSLEFFGEDKGIILLMMALFSLRNPHQRKHKDDFINEIAQATLSIVVSRNVGEKANNLEITPELKKILQDKELFRFQADRNWHINLELKQIKFVLPCLLERKWRLVKAPKDTYFITSDNPVSLVWTTSTHHFSSPGYGLKDTRVLFPLTSELALMGEFDGSEDLFPADNQFLALINDIIFMGALKQVYSREDHFLLYDSDQRKVIKFSETLLQTS